MTVLHPDKLANLTNILARGKRKPAQTHKPITPSAGPGLVQNLAIQMWLAQRARGVTPLPQRGPDTSRHGGATAPPRRKPVKRSAPPQRKHPSDTSRRANRENERTLRQRKPKVKPKRGSTVGGKTRH